MPRPVCPSQIRILSSRDGDSPIKIEAASPADGTSDATLPTFKVVAYNGGLMNVRGFYRPVIVDLTGMKVSAKARPALRDHDIGKIVGHSTKVDVAKKITIAGIVSGTGPDAAEVVSSSANGFPWQASIGASIQKMVMLDDGEKLQVNGKTITGPAYVARQSTLDEVSFVALGADDNSSASVAASGGQSSSIEVFAMNFEQWLEAKGFKLADLSKDQATSLQAMFDAEQDPDPKPEDPPAGDPPPPASKKKAKKVKAAKDPLDGEDDDDELDGPARLKASRKADADERRRVATIVKVCAGKHADIEAQAIEEGWNEDKINLAVLRASRPTGSPPGDGHDGKAPLPEVLEASLCMSSGLPRDFVEKEYSEKVLEAASSKRFRTMSIVGLFHAVIQAAGKYARAGIIDNEFIRTAFQAEQQLQASGGFSTISLSGILGNVANKALLAAYNSVESVLPLFCAERDVNDFKQVTSYRMTGNGEFDEVGPTGELKHASLSEESFTNQVKTYGRMIALTRQQIINDDLGAFLQVPRIIGRMSALKLQKVVYTLLLSNPSSFYSTDNANYQEGAGTVLSIASLTAAEQLFLDQVDSDGQPVAITPAVLLVPSSLKVPAEQFYKDLTMEVTTTADTPRAGSNPHAGKFKPAATPYLNNTGITGYSATAWYLFANPADVAAIEIAYLRGMRTPTIESGETDFNVLGMQWRGFFDFGAAMQDHRATVKSKGAA